MPASAALASTPAPATAAPDPFRVFVESLWPEAEARHVSRTTFDAAFKGVTSDPTVLKLTRNQAEFVRPVWEYLASAITQPRIDLGRKKAAQLAPTLARIEARFGVDRFAFMGIWAMETGFGAFGGNQPVIRVLATLAFANYRGTTFRDELLDALEIVQAGDVTVSAMRGSWAGAMGQTQFLPSSFKAYAVDFDGNGRRDIWTSVPDALASTAFFLKEQGWTTGLPWGFEVILPKGFDATHNEETTFAAFDRWSARGVKRADGAALPQTGEASLLIPAGLRGPAFLVTRNFKVFKAYNNATAYALGVALLGDRISGKGPLVGAWPVHERILTADQARELQTRLRDLGFDVGNIDGRIGERARDAVLAYQAKAGLVADGFPTPELLEKMRATP
jgi:membrane-bound lytic murein transglycosylase B